MAVKESLERLYPEHFDVSVLDLAASCGAKRGDRHIKRAWNFALSFPWSARLSYSLVDKSDTLVKYYLPIMLPDLVRSGINFLGDDPPAAVLSTHYLCTDVAMRARRALGRHYPIVQFVTDPWDAFRWWAIDNIDLHCVASDRAKSMLIDRGVDAERVRVVPYPVARQFLTKGRDRGEIRAELGLLSDRRTVLFTLGRQGIGKTMAWVEEICRNRLRCNLICVAGNNRKAWERLNCSAVASSETNLILLGLSNNMHELLSIADVVVGKAGAATTMEALAQATPAIFVACAGQHERPNVDYVLRHNFGWYAPNQREFIQLLQQLLVGDALPRAQARLGKLTIPLGADALAVVMADALLDSEHPQPGSNPLSDHFTRGC